MQISLLALGWREAASCAAVNCGQMMLVLIEKEDKDRHNGVAAGSDEVLAALTSLAYCTRCALCVSICTFDTNIRCVLEEAQRLVCPSHCLCVDDCGCLTSIISIGSSPCSVLLLIPGLLSGHRALLELCHASGKAATLQICLAWR